MMVGGVDRDVAVEGDTDSSSSWLGRLVKRNETPVVVVDGEAGAAAARRGVSVRRNVPQWLT